MTTKYRIKVAPFDAAEFLTDDESIKGYLEEAFSSGDHREIAAAIGTVARARGMTQVAHEAGVSRESLYRALSKSGNPELSTFLRVLRACGLRLSAPTMQGTAAYKARKTTAALSAAKAGKSKQRRAAAIRKAS